MQSKQVDKPGNVGTPSKTFKFAQGPYYALDTMFLREDNASLSDEVVWPNKVVTTVKRNNIADIVDTQSSRTKNGLPVDATEDDELPTCDQVTSPIRDPPLPDDNNNIGEAYGEPNYSVRVEMQQYRTGNLPHLHVLQWDEMSIVD